MKARKLHRLRAGFIALTSLAVVIGASGQASGASAKWKPDELAKALANPSRPQADRDRDAERKPAQLMSFLGVEPGMTAIDVIAANGYLTEVLSITVGPKGKVYLQNPAMMLQMREGALGKAVADRVAGNRLPNVVRVDGDVSSVPPGSADVAITAMNFHDIYNMGGAAAGQGLMKDVYTALKPGGVFGVIDHAGNDAADNKDLHRVPKHVAIETAKAVGFVVEAESDLYANPADDHTKQVRDPSVRGKTDQFLLRLRKPK